jgi:hypothetical protein
VTLLPIALTAASEFSLTAARDEDVGALFDEELRGSEAYSSGAASYDRHFSL